MNTTTSGVGVGAGGSGVGVGVGTADTTGKVQNILSARLAPPILKQPDAAIEGCLGGCLTFMIAIFAAVYNGWLAVIPICFYLFYLYMYFFGRIAEARKEKKEKYHRMLGRWQDLRICLRCGCVWHPFEGIAKDYETGRVGTLNP